MSFRATVESMSKIMDEMGITELDLERQFLFGVYRKHIHLSKLLSLQDFQEILQHIFFHHYILQHKD